MPELLTLAERCSHAQEIRKSRFLAQAVPVDTPAQALDFLHAVAATAATHHGWAYRIGQGYRFNDDGEPGGTAGRPILQAIDGQGCDQVMVVVTRWYGGIKLGTGGLVRAYGGTAAECLRRAAKVPLVQRTPCRIRCPRADFDAIEALLRASHAPVSRRDFGATGVDLDAEVPTSQVDELTRRIADASRGRAVMRRAGDAKPWPDRA